MKNILLTGGAGYIGSHVCHLLIDQGYKVTCIDSLITGNKELLPKKVKLEIFDIAEKEKVNELIKNNNFDLVMHFAGLIRVDESVEQPERYNDFNYSKAKIFLKTCYENGLKKIIFSSTAAVYGNPKTEKVKETDPTSPLNPYASSKLELENFIKETSKNYNSKYIILRYFNVAGADEKMRTGLISKVSSHLIKIASEVVVGKKDKLIINGDDYNTPDGTAIRDYIHVSDLAEIHIIAANYLINGGESNLFNCGYGNGFSIKDVISELNKIINKDLKTIVGPRRPGDSEMIVSNVEKFMKYFSWKPKYNNLNYILKTAVEWEKKLKS
ncbi:UDP-glucose 4-epimerase GalE [Candidatus Pelagibacter giovannonii]|uniref:UDP-glucose 4-epimerase n=1 Tax=Candidatus Pelagibacter giovannonii TaxID=2563896 RepID=A0A6H1Q2P5_9PROT|nr:UDP-glucose 4-epimerase GalE [Candidatus Pelagibacter giovannonii]QIZ20515.1 UDP-glucose 4-epimerase GalE [Candidatus Pelagibacter giovannonii]